MAKSFPKKKSRQPTGDKIIVNSKAYGQHERAARGSKSKAVLNESMKNHGLRMIASNQPARLIQDALLPYRTNFTGGLFWQRLVKHFAAQAKKNQEYSVIGMNDWDLNKEYPTSRIMAPRMEIARNPFEPVLDVSINYFFSDRFLQRKKDIYAFQSTIIFLFPDFVNNRIDILPIFLPEKKLEDLAPHSFIVHIPDGAGSYLTCFKADALFRSKPTPTEGNVNKVMCLLKSGLL